MLHMNKHSRPMVKWEMLRLRQLNVVVNVDVDGILPMIPMPCKLLWMLRVAVMLVVSLPTMFPMVDRQSMPMMNAVFIWVNWPLLVPLSGWLW